MALSFARFCMPKALLPNLPLSTIWLPFLVGVKSSKSLTLGGLVRSQCLYPTQHYMNRVIRISNPRHSLSISDFHQNHQNHQNGYQMQYAQFRHDRFPNPLHRSPSRGARSGHPDQPRHRQRQTPTRRRPNRLLQ